jgi:hypothetical protein
MPDDVAPEKRELVRRARANSAWRVPWFASWPGVSDWVSSW